MSDEPEWIITKGNEFRIEVTDATGGLRASLRTEDDDSSACTHLWHYYNGSGPWDEDDEDAKPDYWHACSLDDLIAQLQSLNELRKAFLRGEIAVGCPHPCRASYADGRKRCRACGEKSGPWPEPTPPTPFEQQIQNDLVQAYQTLMDGMILGPKPSS